jgi:hypothetical protein
VWEWIWIKSLGIFCECLDCDFGAGGNLHGGGELITNWGLLL